MAAVGAMSPAERIAAARARSPRHEKDVERQLAWRQHRERRRQKRGRKTDSQGEEPIL